MRISVEPGDRAYDPAWANKVAKVTFDGREIKCAVTADEEAGYVKAFKLADDGRPIVVGDSAMMEEHTGGKVVIEMRSEDRKWDTERKVESKVAIGLHPDGTVEVLVYSAVRPGACRSIKIPVSLQPDRGPKLCQLAGVYAGAAAEDYCEKFRDTLDPEDVARVVMTQCRKALTEEAQAQVG